MRRVWQAQAMVNDLSGTDNLAIGRRLIATRAALSMNQRTFALFCGIGPTTLNNFERGRQRPGIESCGLICSAIGARMEWVWKGAAQFMTDERVAMFELTVMGDAVKVAEERHYKLLPAGELDADAVMNYRAGPAA